jgi:3-hydroxybutyrate dehydrogenase
MEDGMKLKGKVALVTGSVQGIGRSIADSLAARGAAIALHGLLDAAGGDELAREITTLYGVECDFFGHDLVKASAADALAQAVLARFGRLDILVNNAGIQHTSPLPEFAQEKWDAVIAINLTAPFALMRAALPAMRRQGFGRVVNISSTHGLVASINKAAYVSAKHGLIGLTRVGALETATDGITVNAICPGWTETPLLEPQIAARAQAKGLDRAAAIRDLVGEKQPNQTLAPPHNIGELVAFLCSDAAAGITGIALPIDGGWTAQ